MNKLLKNNRYDSNGWPRETGFVEAEIIAFEPNADKDTNNGWLTLDGNERFLLLDMQ